MLTLFVIFLFISLAVSSLVKAAKANPAQAVQVASWIGRMLRR